jgi:hypothetical protein
METLLQILNTPEFWMGLSLIAAVLPGPQTRLIPHLCGAIAAALKAKTNPPQDERP